MEKSLLMDEYCKAHKDNNFCEKINQYVSCGFCQLACKGDWKKYYCMPLDELRAKYRKPLSKEERENKETVSVIIPYCKHDEQYVERTVENVKENAVGLLEIILMEDAKDDGLRVMMNRGVEKSNGKYVMKLDAHCAMSPEWDARMKASCRPGIIIKPMIDSLDEDTWKGRGRDCGFMSLDNKMRAKQMAYTIPMKERKIEEETLQMYGCCFMMHREYYDKHKGCDESIGKWGALGIEWSFKTWLTGGELLIRTDVVCYHLFRLTKPFHLDQDKLDRETQRWGQKWQDGLGEGQTRPLSWLLFRFKKYITPSLGTAPREQRTPSLYKVGD